MLYTFPLLIYNNLFKELDNPRVTLMFTYITEVYSDIYK